MSDSFQILTPKIPRSVPSTLKISSRSVERWAGSEQIKKRKVNWVTLYILVYIYRVGQKKRHTHVCWHNFCLKNLIGFIFWVVNDWPVGHNVSNFGKNPKSLCQETLTFAQIFSKWPQKSRQWPCCIPALAPQIFEFLIAYEHPLSSWQICSVD